jgi:hypothetical protein
MHFFGGKFLRGIFRGKNARKIGEYLFRNVPQQILDLIVNGNFKTLPVQRPLPQIFLKKQK